MIELLRIVYYVTIITIIVILVLIFVQKYVLNLKRKTEPKVREYLFQKLERDVSLNVPFSKKRIFNSLQDIGDQIKLTRYDKESVYRDLFNEKDILKLRKQAESIFSFRRLLAAHHLSFIPNQRGFIILRIKNEKNPLVLFYLFYLSLDIINEELFDHVMQKIIGMNEELIYRFSMVIANHYDVFRTYLLNYANTTVREHRIVQLHAAVKIPSYLLPDEMVYHLKNELFNASNEDPLLMRLFLDYLETIEDEFLLEDPVLKADKLSVRKYGYQAIAHQNQWSSVEQLFEFTSDDDQQNQVIFDLLSELSDNNQILNRLFYYEQKLKSPLKRQTLAQILSENVSYIILKLGTNEREMAQSNIDLMIEFDYTAGLIAFINANRDTKLESLIFDHIDLKMFQNKKLHHDFFIHIKPAILKRHGLDPVIPKSIPKAKHPVEWSKVIWLIIVLIIALSIYPVLSLIKHWDNLDTLTFSEIFINLVIDTNQNLVYYFIVANVIYLFLMMVSLWAAHKQNVLWEIKSNQLLYEDDLLPPISIIAPAYNEEVNIITSVRSLLNLKYPHYEVIVVNDGSKDDTLGVLIEYFNLKRGSPYIKTSLETKDIRGIYYNHEFPNLYVVNKVNGGKADALNVGINVSNHPYICGIDADSVLDQDALLRLMSSSIDHKEKAIALGGNIVPANGCKIDYGHVDERHFPKEILTRFQAVEYLRSFSSGRLGWSELNGLLIISGAFGLFHKKDIIDIGGYITSSGSLKKDSVGEDMELVVRLTHQRMRQHKQSYIGYIYHANCYTELPSDRKTLFKQRNRWHRGLIDILNYHRRMSFNPKYKHIGMVVFPYFYVFEVLGPFFEWIGYTALLVSFIYGFLSPVIIGLIFGLSIILGVIISLLSLLIQESRNTYMTKKDTIYLMIFSILENFGYRQVLSLHRLYSFFSAFIESGKWGEQKRKGI